MSAVLSSTLLDSFSNCYISGDASKGLRDLKEIRRRKYGHRDPPRTALSDLASQIRKEEEKNAEANLETVRSQVPHTSKFTNKGEQVPYDVLHPASPRVSKGAPGKGGKKSRSIEKVEEKNDAYVSDVDIPPSGTVALVANALSMEQESPSDSANSDEGKYELTYLPLIFSVSLLHIEVRR